MQMKPMKRGLKLVAMMASLMLVPQLALAQWSDGQAEEPQGRLVIRGGWLFDSVSNERRPNTGLVIEDGKIVEVDADVQQQSLSTADVLDLAETDTILPGMIDLHAHYNLDLVDKGRVEEVVHNGIVFLANGVTSTWSAGEYYPERVLAQRDRIDAGESIGPRLFASGPYFGAYRCE
jgi:imidazolonepropionase-like amidohydrolase